MNAVKLDTTSDVEDKQPDKSMAPCIQSRKQDSDQGLENISPRFFFCHSNEHSKWRHHFASHVLHHRDAHDYTFASLLSHINISLFPQHWRSCYMISSIQASFHLLPICNDFTPHAHTDAPQTLVLTYFQRQKEKKNDMRLLTSLQRENQNGGQGFSSCV